MSSAPECLGKNCFSRKNTIQDMSSIDQYFINVTAAKQIYLTKVHLLIDGGLSHLIQNRSLLNLTQRKQTCVHNKIYLNTK